MKKMNEDFDLDLDEVVGKNGAKGKKGNQANKGNSQVTSNQSPNWMMRNQSEANTSKFPNPAGRNITPNMNGPISNPGMGHHPNFNMGQGMYPMNQNYPMGNMQGGGYSNWSSFNQEYPQQQAAPPPQQQQPPHDPNVQHFPNHFNSSFPDQYHSMQQQPSLNHSMGGQHPFNSMGHSMTMGVPSHSHQTSSNQPIFNSNQQTMSQTVAPSSHANSLGTSIPTTNQPLPFFKP